MIHELFRAGGSVSTISCPFPEALAVIEGNNPGWVFADDLNNPRSLLVWAQGIEGFYLVGDADNPAFLYGLDVYIDQVLEPRLHNLGVTWFEVSGDETWNPIIERTFEKRDLECNQQWVYTLNPTVHKPVRQPESIDDCRLLSVKQCQHADLPLTNKEFLFSKLFRFWGSMEAFLSNGIGYLLLCGEEIVSLCFSGFVARDVHVIDIETETLHRRKGYAKIVAQALILACMRRQLQLHWDCMAENIASVGLAEKLGLTKSHAYTLYSFPL